MQPCLLKDGSLRRETLSVLLSDKCKTHSRDSQLDSCITVPDLLYVSAVESLKAPVFYKLRTCNVVLFRSFRTWYMSDLLSLLIFISLTNLKPCHVTAVQLWAELFIQHKSGYNSLVNGPQPFPPRLLHLKPKLNLYFFRFSFWQARSPFNFYISPWGWKLHHPRHPVT